MNPRSVLVLAILAAVSVAAAVYAVWTAPGMTTVELADTPAFPDLRARPGAVARITVTDGENTVTLERGADDAWSVAERAGYGAAPARVRELVTRLADMRLAEPKTARPDRFARLGVADPAGPGVGARHATLSDSEGGVLAAAVIGRRVFTATGGSDAGTYIRRDGDDRAWLAGGGVAVDADPRTWLRPNIVEIAPESVRSIEFVDRDGGLHAVARSADTAAFVVAPPRDDMTVDQDALRKVLGVLSSLRLEDVAQRRDVMFPLTPDALTVTTEQGVTFQVRTSLKDGRWWITVDVEGTGQAADEANRLRAALAPWAFRISDADGLTLTSRPVSRTAADAARGLGGEPPRREGPVDR